MDRRYRGRLRRRMRGMTLVEIMVVVAIIGMLMGTVGVYAYGRLEKARVSDTKMVIHSVEQALVHYQTDNSEGCPKSLSELQTQKYLTKEPKDAWGSPLIFVCPGTHNPDSADITSLGKDKKEGGEGTNADIHSWDM